MKPHFWMVLFCATLLVTAGCEKNDETAAQGTSGVDLAQGEKVYSQRCAACHDRGLAGSPRNGNKEDWTAAIAQGIDVMVEHSINGYKGQRGFMPARGGHSGLSDSDVTAAVHYLVKENK
jgi:cytochrome c5